MKNDLRQDTLDLILDTIVAYETKLRTGNTLTSADTYLLKELSAMLTDHYINAPCSDFDRYTFTIYQTRANTLIEKGRLLKP